MFFIAALLLSGFGNQSYATFDLWEINEVFSSADGTVQYIELATSFSGQQFVAGHRLVSSDGGVNQNVFNFSSNLVGDTRNKKVLIATETFASITGLTPDYTIPENFIFIGGGQLDFEGADTLGFTKEQLPLNGVQSFDGNTVPQTATPTNFAGMSAALSTNTYSTLNVETLIMNVPVLDLPGIGILNLSFSVDPASLLFTLLDGFYVYGNGITAGDNAAQFQNNSVLYIPGMILGNDLIEFNLTLIPDDLIVFGELDIISVTNLLPDPEPEPDPPLQWSISEIFSNANGTVQFIELATSEAGQQALSGHSLVSSDNEANQNVFNFTSNLATDTQNKTLLLATDTFASITGLTPDFTIPDNFIYTTGGDLNFSDGADILNFTKEQLPLNGVQSVDGNTLPQTATPTNFSGESESLSINTYGSLNLDTLVMNLPVVDNAFDSGIGNLSFSVNPELWLFTLLDVSYFYENGITAGDNPAQFQDGGVLYIPGLILGNDVYELDMILLGENPTVFGNPNVLGVTNLEPEPDPDPDPDPDPGPGPY